MIFKYLTVNETYNKLIRFRTESCFGFLLNNKHYFDLFETNFDLILTEFCLGLFLSAPLRKFRLAALLQFLKS